MNPRTTDQESGVYGFSLINFTRVNLRLCDEKHEKGKRNEPQQEQGSASLKVRPVFLFLATENWKKNHEPYQQEKRTISKVCHGITPVKRIGQCKDNQSNEKAKPS